MMHTQKIIIYSSLVLILALTTYLWFSQSGVLLHEGPTALYLSLGRLAGLLLALSILFQFVIIGRVGWIEQVFGLDKLSRVHRWVGFSTVLFLVAHPVFIAWSYGWGSGDTAWHQIFSLMFSSRNEILQASIGALLIIGVATASFLMVFKKLRYEYWYGIHLLTYLAIFISFGHQTELGGDLQASLSRAFWFLLYVGAGAVYVWFRFIQPLYTYYTHRFVVDRAVSETHNVYAVYIQGRDIQHFQFTPGQFIIVRFFARGVWCEAHPFSISGRGEDGSIRITIKASGDFTQKLPRKIKQGTSVFIDGPHGVFGKNITQEEKILCISGGIGITPIVPLVEQAGTLKKDVKVLVSFREARDAVYQEELRHVVGDVNVRTVYTHEQDPRRGEKIDEQLLQEFCPDIAQRSVYLCGPVPFMHAMKQAALVLGAPRDKIHYEQFSL